MAETRLPHRLKPEPLGIYIHWPYCRHLCPYCAFNVHKQKTAIDAALWQKAFLTELDHYYEKTAHLSVQSLFFGGGTPSLMPAQLVEAIVNHCVKRWKHNKTVEVNLEVNPNDFQSIHAYAQAGVTRFSIGVQALNHKRLAFLARQHSQHDIRKAFTNAQRYTDNISADIISCLPQDTQHIWQKELEDITQMDWKHLSIYSLTIEAKTAFSQAVAIGRWQPKTQDQQAQFYQQTYDYLTAQGWQRYEISSHSIAKAYQCQHNLNYWQYGNYLGIGPGSHGRIHHNQQSWAWQNHKKPEHWLQRCQSKKHGRENHEWLNQWQQMLEYVLLGLRLADGIDLNRCQNIIDSQKAQHCQEQGWLTIDHNRLRLTADGIPRHDALVSYLLSSYSESSSSKGSSKDCRPFPTMSKRPLLIL